MRNLLSVLAADVPLSHPPSLFLGLPEGTEALLDYLGVASPLGFTWMAAVLSLHQFSPLHLTLHTIQNRCVSSAHLMLPFPG